MRRLPHSPAARPGAVAARRHAFRHRLPPEPLLIALTVMLAWLSGAALGAAETPDLSGTWEMDKELSEDPMEKMRERPSSGMRGGGPGGGRGGPGRGGPGGPGGGRGGGARSDGQSREEMRERMREARVGLERLEIAQSGSEVLITYADSREQVLTTDNKKSTIETPFGEGTIRARWRDDGGLLVKTRTERRKTAETYYVTRDGRMMTVLVEMDTGGPMGRVSFKRIYRPAAPGDEAIPAEDAETDSVPASR